MVTGKGHVDLAEEELTEEDMGGGHPGDDTWELEVDVYNAPTEIVIVAQLAGVDTNDLYIKVKEDVLTISGTKKRPASILKKDEHLFSGECKWGRFERAVILPQNVDVTKINAKLGKDKGELLKLFKFIDKQKKGSFTFK